MYVLTFFAKAKKSFRIGIIVKYTEFLFYGKNNDQINEKHFYDLFSRT